MNVTQYNTNKYGDFISSPLKPAIPLSGTVKANAAPLASSSAFSGFGVAITGSSCYNLAQMPQQERTAFLKSIYSKDGLGLSVGRLSIGSSDYSAELYTYDDVDNDLTLEHFSIDRDKEYIIPIIREILEINPDILLFASPGSPPAWMKTGHSVGGGYMREKYIECYAEYFVKYIKAYEQEGITIQAVTPQNEPETAQSGKMPACIWHPDIEAKFISALHRKLKENGLDTEIWAYDHSFSGAGRVKWCFDEYPDLINDCSGVAFHYYDGTIEDTVFLKEKFAGLQLHFTEGGPRLYDHYDTDWCKWTSMMVKTLNSGYSSFTGWNLMLDETGGPNIGPFFCGGLVTRNRISQELSFSGQYRAFRHVAPFVKKDSKIYPLVFSGKGVPMFGYPKTFEMPMDGTLIENTDGSAAMILVNHDSSKKQVQYFRNDQWWYIELLPETAATIVFKE